MEFNFVCLKSSSKMVHLFKLQVKAVRVIFRIKYIMKHVGKYYIRTKYSNTSISLNNVNQLFV